MTSLDVGLARLRSVATRVSDGWARFDRSFKSIMPKGLYARSLLIIIVPMVVLQSVVAFVFMERHWSYVTQNLSAAVVQDVAAVIEMTRSFPQDAERTQVRRIAQERLGLQVDFLPLSEMPPPGPKPFFSLLDNALSVELRRQIARPFWIDTVGRSNLVEVRIQLDNAVMRVFARRSAAYASNSEIFLLWMVGTSLVLLTVAILFLRNQIRPILRLADAAESFGKGREVPNFRPRGAREVRRAAAAFLEMKGRIERAIEQRTAMLAGVSHDLRTVLTRFKLELALLGEGSEVEAMKRDVDEMGRMLEAYLAFARGDTGELSAQTDMAALLEELKDDAERHGHKATVAFHGQPIVTVKPAAFKRCLANLVSNAARHAPSIAITGHRDHRWLTVTIDDAGPGIPLAMREEVFKPFLRLDTARNQDEGGTGLGLAIARDIARSHGGEITLGDSPMGGLRATEFVHDPTGARWDRAQPVQQADHALPACELAVERCERLGVTFVFVVDPGPQHIGKQEHKPLRPQYALRTRCRDAGGGQHPLLRAHAKSIEREREAGIAPRRAQQRAHRGLVRLKHIEPAHQHVEQPLAGGFLCHVGRAAGEHLAVDLLDIGGENRK
jgi:two-component system osmolarity sensor histidine kinase EnvZ